MANAGDADVFLAKLDFNGNGLWEKQIGNSSTGVSPYSASICMDAVGNVLLTGNVMGAVDFGVFLAGTSSSGYDVFVAKYAAAGGALQWVKRTTGDAGDCGQAIAVKPSGDAVVTGRLYVSADFGCGALLSSGDQDAFLVELGP